MFNLLSSNKVVLYHPGLWKYLMIAFLSPLQHILLCFLYPPRPHFIELIFSNLAISSATHCLYALFLLYDDTLSVAAIPSVPSHLAVSAAVLVFRIPTPFAKKLNLPKIFYLESSQPGGQVKGFYLDGLISKCVPELDMPFGNIMYIVCSGPEQ